MLDEASYFGRIFARCGGLAEAVAQGIKEHGHTDFELKATSCDGIEQCRIALFKKSKKLLDANFIEGMACTGGCIGGAGCLTHGPRSRAEVNTGWKPTIKPLPRRWQLWSLSPKHKTETVRTAGWQCALF